MTDIPSWAVVGAKVTLIRPVNGGCASVWIMHGLEYPKFGVVYTIRDIVEPYGSSTTFSLRLNEIRNHTPPFSVQEPAASISIFRPITSSKAQVAIDVAKFTHLLAGNDAKIVEPA